MSSTINYFNKSHIKNNNSFLIIGSYKKSFVVKDILHNLDIIYGCVVTNKSDYVSWCKPQYCFSQLNQQLMSEYKNIQMKYKQKSFLFIDVINGTNLFQKTYIKEFMFMHQCYNTSIIIAADNICDVDVNNITYIIILKEDNEEKRLKIYSLFVPVFGTYENFSNVMNTLTYRKSLIIENNNYCIYLSYLRCVKLLF